MPYNSKYNVKDGDNKPIASYFSEENDQFEPIKGQDGATYFHQKGSLILDFIQGTGNKIFTFPEPIRGLYLKNIGDTPLIFTVEGKTATLDPDEAFEGLFKLPFTQLQITAAGPYKGHINE